VKIYLHAVGQRMPAWVTQGYEDYAKRLKGECTLVLKEVAPGKRGKNAPLARVIEDEGTRLLDSLPKNPFVVALDVKGKPWSTPELAEHMQRWMQQGQDVSLLVGGPDGLSQACVQRAQTRWSLSALTFPHPLVRVILAEQLFRAYSVLKNHPYHREG